MPQPITAENLEYITKKLYALFAKYGFDGISMDEVSRQMNISKATLYRYFTSKEDIVRSMVQYLNTHLDSVQFSDCADIRDVTDALQAFYVKSLLNEALSGMQFLTDLEHKFPEMYRSCRFAMDAMQERFSNFYRMAVERGFFKELPFSLVSRQFQSMLPAIISVDYLEEQNLTLVKAIRAYYRMFLEQILTEAYLPVTGREKTYAFADEVARVLQEDFFVDSIRR